MTVAAEKADSNPWDLLAGFIWVQWEGEGTGMDESGKKGNEENNGCQKQTDNYAIK